MAFLNIFSTKLKNWFGSNSDESTTTLDKFKAQVRFVNAAHYLLGYELKKDWRFNIRTRLCLYVILTVSWILSYSTYVEFGTLMMVTVIAAWMLLLLSARKFLMMVFNYHKFLSLLDFCLIVVERNFSEDKEVILSNTVDKISLHLKIVSVGMFSGLAFYSLYPFYDFIFNGNLTLLGPCYLPLIDDTQLTGYLIETIVLIFISCYGVLVSYVFSILFVLYVDIYDAMVSLMEAHLKEFDSMCEINNENTILQRRAMFRNITLEAMDLARYSSYMKELFNPAATVQTVGCYVGTITLLFSYLASDYMSGIGGTAYFVTDFMMLCFPGQLFENTNENIAHVLYKSKWYTYQNQHQKDMRFLLHLVQNCQPIYIAGIHPLNFKTGLWSKNVQQHPTKMNR